MRSPLLAYAWLGPSSIVSLSTVRIYQDTHFLAEEELLLLLTLPHTPYQTAWFSRGSADRRKKKKKKKNKKKKPLTTRAACRRARPQTSTRAKKKRPSVVQQTHNKNNKQQQTNNKKRNSGGRRRLSTHDTIRRNNNNNTSIAVRNTIMVTERPRAAAGGAGGANNSVTFPVLKNPVILQIMREVNVPLSEMELAEPGRCKERIREVFAQLLNICLGLDDPAALLSSLDPQRAVAAVVVGSKSSKSSNCFSLSHPELYRDALPETMFFCLLSRQLRICGYDDFGFRDLAMPQAKRLRRQLSALINFLKYREDMSHLEAQALDEREELFAALDEVTENHMTLKDRLDEARAFNRARVMEREEAEAECKEMEGEIAQQNKIQASIRQETYLLKKTANELQDQIANLSIAMRELKAEERRLSKELVGSPERIRADLAEAKRRLEGVRGDVSVTQDERASVQRRVEHASIAEEGVGRMASVMEGMDTAVREYEMAAEDLEDAQNALRGMEREREGMTEERGMQEEIFDAAVKRKADVTSSLADALLTAQNDLDSAVARLGTVESEVVEGMARIEASERRVVELRTRIERERRIAEEDVAGRLASFGKFEERYWEKERELSARVGY
ncbi:hypothetical protein ACHAW5_000998 [Stephanodiscus triporus]|uniref:Kinetochore protein Nuf2 N-terminal domain-containing protein n=1 Tax=Stephanodiscus triporus TaxID=2934178 RepID=A0ABD3NF80_9STRA